MAVLGGCKQPELGHAGNMPVGVAPLMDDASCAAKMTAGDNCH